MSLLSFSGQQILDWFLFVFLEEIYQFNNVLWCLLLHFMILIDYFAIEVTEYMCEIPATISQKYRVLKIVTR